MSVVAESRRCTSAEVAEARKLHEAGWTFEQIARILRRRGFNVWPYQVRRWVDDELATKRREADRRMKALRRAADTGGRLRGHFKSPEAKVARIRGLFDAGLAPAHIARVLNFDFDCGLTAADVNTALVTGEPPRKLIARRTA